MTDLEKTIRRRSNTETKRMITVTDEHGNATRRPARLVVEIRPGATDTIFIREERRRNGYQVPLDKVYQLGARLEAEAIRATKAKARKAKTKGGPR